MIGEEFNKLAEYVADKIGSPLSIFIHTVLFILNLMVMPIVGINRTLLILTTWVSLEAIYLSLFTQLVITNQKKQQDGKKAGKFKSINLEVLTEEQLALLEGEYKRILLEQDAGPVFKVGAMEAEPEGTS